MVLDSSTTPKATLPWLDSLDHIRPAPTGTPSPLTARVMYLDFDASYSGWEIPFFSPQGLIRIIMQRTSITCYLTYVDRDLFHTTFSVTCDLLTTIVYLLPVTFFSQLSISDLFPMTASLTWHDCLPVTCYPRLFICDLLLESAPVISLL